MKIQTTLVMLALFAVAVGLYALVQYAELPTAAEREQRRGRVFADLKTDQVDRIELEQDGRKIVLQRGGAGWQMTEPINVLADSGRADEIIRQIAQLRMKSQGGAVSLKGSAAADLSQYGLAKPKTRAALFHGSERVADLSIGDEVFGGRYVKNKAEDKFVYVVEPSTLNALERPVNQLRQRGLVTIGTFDADYVRLTRSDQAITLVKEGNEWQLTEPIKDGADAARVRQLLGDAAALKAQTDDDFVDDDVTPQERSRYGLDAPGVVIELRKPSEKSSGSKQETVAEKILIGGGLEGKEGKRYAMIDGQSYAIAIDAVAVAKLDVAPVDLRSRNLVKLAAMNVDYFRIDTPGSAAPVVAAKPGTTWTIRQPKAADGDAAAIAQFLRDLGGLQIREFLDGADPSEYGLTEDAAITVSIWEKSLAAAGASKEAARDEARDANQPETAPQPKGTPTKLLFGKHDAQNKRLYAVRPGKPGVVAVDDSILATLHEGYLAFRDRKIFDFLSAAQVARIDLVRDGQSFTVVHETGKEAGTLGTWRMSAPVDAAADPKTAESIVGLFSSLRAGKLVAEAPEDLAAYGLDAPPLDVTLALEQGGRETQPQQHRLLIGKELTEAPPQKGGPEELYYAKQPDGTLVFTIPATKVQVLRDELRDRNVLSFAASEVTALTLTYPDRKLELQFAAAPGESAKKWSFVGGAPFELDAGKVQALVDALAKLQATAFEQYQGELQERYGLAAPALSVEITLGEGMKKSLTLGAAASDNARYAATPELPGAVFRVADPSVTSVVSEGANVLSASAKSEAPDPKSETNPKSP